MFKSKEKKFWDWFVKNKSKIENFLESEKNDYSIYNELTEKIKNYNELLSPEITGDENDFHFIITPDGIKHGMEPTSKLFDKAPKISGWKIFKYRQPKDEFTININSVTLDMESIRIVRGFEVDNVDIAVCIKNFSEENKDFKIAGFLMLDHVLGEYNVITKVRQIDFYAFEKLSPEYETISLLQLRKEIEEKLY